MPTHRILKLDPAPRADYAVVMHVNPPVRDCLGGLMLHGDRVSAIQTSLGVTTQADLVDRTLQIDVRHDGDKRYFTFRAPETYLPS